MFGWQQNRKNNKQVVCGVLQLNMYQIYEFQIYYYYYYYLLFIITSFKFNVIYTHERGYIRVSLTITVVISK